VTEIEASNVKASMFDQVEFRQRTCDLARVGPYVQSMLLPLSEIMIFAELLEFPFSSECVSLCVRELSLDAGERCPLLATSDAVEGRHIIRTHPRPKYTSLRVV
jgi:hypothetical protein